jgi:RND family efflux transporter MFP subunit
MSDISHSAPPPKSAARQQPNWVLWLATGSVFLATIGLVILIANRPTPVVPPPEKVLANVAVQKIQVQPYAESLILPARLEADRTASISSELAGRLQRWLVQEGASVAAGDVLAELNDEDLQAELAELLVQSDSVAKQVNVAEQDLEVAKAALEQAVQDAKALELTLESSQADLDFSTKEFERITRLAKQEIATTAELDRVRNQLTQAQVGVAKAKDAIERAQITVRSAKARLGQSEAALGLSRVRIDETQRAIDSLRITIAKTKIRAPFAGRFEEHLVEAGDVVVPGVVLGRVYDTAFMRVAVDVPDRLAPFLDDENPLLAKYLEQSMPGTHQELKASVQIPGLPKLTGGRHAGVEIPAVIARVAQAANEVSHTFRTELRLPNPGMALRAGMIVRARIDFLAYDNAIVIPLAAVQVADVGPRVLVIEERNGKAIARMRDIEPTSIRDDEVLVQNGLSANETIVVAGGRGVLDGEQVNVVVANGVVIEQSDKTNGDYILIPPEEPGPEPKQAAAGEGGVPSP